MDSFDLENPLADSGGIVSDSVVSLFIAESDHTLSENYFSTLQDRDFDVLVRREAISSISQFSCDLDPLTSYLAVNYLDRFLSCSGMPLTKQWVVKLLAISCVSLASKMMKKTEISFTGFLSNGGIVFETQTIARMETLILGALKWRMRSITPFSFIPFFVSLFKLQDPPLCQALKSRAIQILFKAQNDINLLEYKPSIVAASALLSASHELFPLQFPCFRHSLSSCSHLNKDDMSHCYSALQVLLWEEYYCCDVVSSSLTPVNVLDQRFSSSAESGINNIIINNNSQNDNDNGKSITVTGDRDAKRRRLIGDRYS